MFTFNPWTEKWTKQPQMNERALVSDPGGARRRPDARRSAATATTRRARILNLDPRDLQAEDPRRRAWGRSALHPEVSLPIGMLYPHMFTLPDERVLVAGPLPKHSALIDARDPRDPVTWTDLPRLNEMRNGGNAVLDPGGPRGSWKVTMLGGTGGLTKPDGYPGLRRRDDPDDRRQASRRGVEDGALRTSAAPTRTRCCFPTARW